MQNLLDLAIKREQDITQRHKQAQDMIATLQKEQWIKEKQLETRISELEKLGYSAQQEANQFKHENDDLKQRLHKLKFEYEHLKSESDNRMNAITRQAQESALDQAEQRYRIAKNDVREKEEQIETLSRRLRSLEKQQEEEERMWKSKLNKMEDDIERTSHKERCLHHRLKEEEEKAQEAGRAAREMATVIKDLRYQVQELESTKVSLQSWKSRTESLQQSLFEAEAQINILQQKLEHMEESAETAEEETDRIRKQWQQSVEELEQELVKNANQEKEMRFQLNQAQAESEQVRAAVRIKDAIIDDQNENIRNLKSQIATLNNQLNEFEREQKDEVNSPLIFYINTWEKKYNIIGKNRCVS